MWAAIVLNDTLTIVFFVLYTSRLRYHKYSVEDVK